MGVNLTKYNPLEFAYIGDAVYELLVRKNLLGKGKINELNKIKISYVNAEFQASAYDRVKEVLSEEEFAVMKSGRNSNPKTIAKNTDPLVYKKATGLESLFGFLFLSGEFERLNELCNSILK
ncbi:MAG: ribonuclease III [Ruminococcus sp.]|jgi:ribonuclease-3 family protein|nr:ribonuclease III [Ruminococcus sp.]